MKLVTIKEREKSLKDELQRIVEVIKTEYAPVKERYSFILSVLKTGKTVYEKRS
jgi:hypothetical protein